MRLTIKLITPMIVINYQAVASKQAIITNFNRKIRANMQSIICINILPNHYRGALIQNVYDQTWTRREARTQNKFANFSNIKRRTNNPTAGKK